MRFFILLSSQALWFNGCCLITQWRIGIPTLLYLFQGGWGWPCMQRKSSSPFLFCSRGRMGHSYTHTCTQTQNHMHAHTHTNRHRHTHFLAGRTGTVTSAMSHLTSHDESEEGTGQRTVSYECGAINPTIRQAHMWQSQSEPVIFHLSPVCSLEVGACIGKKRNVSKDGELKTKFQTPSSASGCDWHVQRFKAWAV